MDNQFIQQQTISPESLEQELIPESVSELVARLAENREQLLRTSEELGLNTEYLKAIFAQPIQVGLAEQNFPLPTLFPDGVGEMVMTFSLMRSITQALQQAGFSAEQRLLIALEFDSFVSSGYAACDYIVFKKSDKENEKITFLGSNSERKSLGMVPYGSLEVTEANVAKAIERMKALASNVRSLRNAAGENPIEISKAVKQVILNTIFADTQEAFIQSDGSYYTFIKLLNAKIVKRAFGSSPETIEAEPVYQSFLKFGLAAPERFFQVLINAGFSANGNYKAFRMLGPSGKMIELSIVALEPLMLRCDELDENYLFTDLVQRGLIFPKKELAYFLEMSGILPQIYLDDNQKFYEPYIDTMQVLAKLGLKPVMFPYRERKSIGVNDAVTIFDFYGTILTNEG